MKLNDNECSRDRYLSKEMEPSLLSSLRENPLHSSLSLFFSTHVHDFVYPSSSSHACVCLPFLHTNILYISSPPCLSSPCIPPIDVLFLSFSFHRRRERERRRAKENKKTGTIGQEDHICFVWQGEQDI